MQCRHFLAGLAGAVVFTAISHSTVADASLEPPPATEWVRSPAQFQGPYYPDGFPRDTDNDLVTINDNDKSARGEVVHLFGRVLDANGRPLQNVRVELWQTDSNGVYLHSRSPNRSDYDLNFQGFGRTLTGPDGKYYFRTLRPASHVENRMRRAPHFHFAVYVEERPPFCTQAYILGEPLNDRDPILNSINDPEQREAVVRTLQYESGSDDGALKLEFDIVLGVPNGN